MTNISKIIKLIKTIRLIFLSFVKEELLIKNNLSLFEKIKYWKKGFLSRSVILFSLREKNKDIKNYLTDYDYYIKTPFINGGYKYLLKNKLIFFLFFRNYPELFAHVHFLITKKAIICLDNTSQDKIVDLDAILNLLFQKQKLIIKKSDGSGGKQIYLASIQDNSIFLNYEKIEIEKFKAFLKNLDDYIVCDYVIQHKYSQEIFPYAANSIRMVTMWDYEKGAPFISGATHRFGCNPKSPTDNFIKGGLCCLIDIQTGILNKGIWLENYKKNYYTNHPLTKTRLEGVQVPNWTQIKENILKLASEIPFIPYIGWDIIVTDKGFKVLEANSCPGISTLQSNKPLLEDLRVKKFYIKHEILQ